jgi:endonuclease I
MFKKYFFVVYSILFFANTNAQIPNNYYNTCIGSSGNALRSKLKTIISYNHFPVGYAGLWNVFYTSDVKPNGKLWDIYSYKFSGPQPYEFTMGTNQCGTYNNEGDCYNREHTWPQSNFLEAEPMRSDLHQVFPTDGTVNGMHSDDPYGKVISATKTSLQGCKSGISNNYPGYSGKTFEPIDSFKGDIARAYFYMTTRYYGEDAGWLNWPMANGANLTADAINVLLDWHRLDPVSKKEIDRNEVIYTKQGNRNPFIDSASFVECIWGNVFCGNVGIRNNTVTKGIQFVQQENEIEFQNRLDFDAPINYLLYNSFGQLIEKENVSRQKINIANLVPGLYIIVLRHKSDVQHIRFIKH